MKIRRFAQHAVAGVLVLMSFASSPVMAQSDHSHAAAAHASAHQKAKASALVKVVRDATARFHDVAVAECEGYFLQFGCVSGSDFGAMGMHFVNLPLVDGWRAGRHASGDRHLRTAAGRQPATDRRGLPRARGRSGTRRTRVRRS